jgi:hypothetical protein
VLDEVLHAVDRSWLPGTAGLAQAADWISSSETKDGTPLGFKQMLYLYVGADTNLPAIEAKLIKPSEAAGRAVLRQRAAVVEGAAALVRLGGGAGRGGVDYRGVDARLEMAPGLTKSEFDAVVKRVRWAARPSRQFPPQKLF